MIRTPRIINVFTITIQSASCRAEDLNMVVALPSESGFDRAVPFGRDDERAR